MFRWFQHWLLEQVFLMLHFTQWNKFYTFIGDWTCWTRWEIVPLPSLFWWYHLFQASKSYAQVVMYKLYILLLLFFKCKIWTWPVTLCSQWRSRWICSKQVPLRNIFHWHEAPGENPCNNQRIFISQIWYERRGSAYLLMLH
jgi:hypothetical protein